VPRRGACHSGTGWHSFIRSRVKTLYDQAHALSAVQLCQNSVRCGCATKAKPGHWHATSSFWQLLGPGLALKTIKPKSRPQLNRDSLKPVLTSLVASEPNGADRDHLLRWLDDPRADDVWTTISKLASKRHGVVLAERFVHDVLSCRRLATNPNTFPSFLEHAKAAAKLASFLRGPQGMPPPMPHIPNYMSLANALDEAARLLREQATKSDTGLGRSIRTRRSRPHLQFIRFLGETMSGFCGQSLDYETAVLTDIAFPGQETSVEAVRSARRPTTSKARAGAKNG
jgi:hypothetical protein